MTEEASRDEMNKALFSNLVMMLSTSAMQQMGKLVNPAAGKTTVDLEGAQFSIDMLEMLRTKTKGNLDRTEESLLGGILSSLQMNYVEAATAAVAAPDAPPASAEPAADPGPAKGPGEEPRYRKSYG